MKQFFILYFACMCVICISVHVHGIVFTCTEKCRSQKKLVVDVVECLPQFCCFLTIGIVIDKLFFLLLFKNFFKFIFTYQPQILLSSLLQCLHSIYPQNTHHPLLQKGKGSHGESVKPDIFSCSRTNPLPLHQG